MSTSKSKASSDMTKDIKKKQNLKVTLMLSKFGRKKNHANCVKGLGLRRIRDSVVVNDTPCIRGLITKIAYLLKVEEV